MRYFEDFAEGQVYELGEASLSEAEIVEFARKYDPQPFHVDQAAAQQSMFGGLIASGWQTGSLYMGPASAPRESTNCAGSSRCAPATCCAAGSPSRR
jgi:acyl dehydratase